MERMEKMVISAEEAKRIAICDSVYRLNLAKFKMALDAINENWTFPIEECEILKLSQHYLGEVLNTLNDEAYPWEVMERITRGVKEE